MPLILRQNNNILPIYISFPRRIYGDTAMVDTLNRKKVAILATDGFEQVEQTERKKSLEDAGATVSRALCESHSERD
jgi:hypothetical protein